jgi:hypothetical protein
MIAGFVTGFIAGFVGITRSATGGSAGSGAAGSGAARTVRGTYFIIAAGCDIGPWSRGVDEHGEVVGGVLAQPCLEVDVAERSGRTS